MDLERERKRIPERAAEGCPERLDPTPSTPSHRTPRDEQQPFKVRVVDDDEDLLPVTCRLSVGSQPVPTRSLNMQAGVPYSNAMAGPGMATAQ